MVQETLGFGKHCGGSVLCTLSWLQIHMTQLCSCGSLTLGAFSRLNGAWLFTADVMFIYMSIENLLALTQIKY